MTKDAVILNEMATFRLPTTLIDRLDDAKRSSDLTKTVHIKRALTDYLDKHFPVAHKSVH